MLLRVEQKDFKIIWEVNEMENCLLKKTTTKELIVEQRNKQYLHGVITSLSQLTNTLGKEMMEKILMKQNDLDPKRRASEFDPSLLPQVASSKFFKDDPSEYHPRRYSS